jgi:DNA-binding XRE family transcriptional regulator/PHD/YefM family antitoxin component YafN of YafNO toxin-antitoxin module
MANRALDKIKPQTIVSPSGDKMVMISADDFAHIMALAIEAEEDSADVAAATRTLERIASGEEGTIPLDVYKRLKTENRIKVLREHSGMTQRALAAAAGTDPMYVSQLETGRARGGLDVLRNIASALKVPLELVVPREAPAGKPQEGIHEYGKRKLKSRKRK